MENTTVQTPKDTIISNNQFKQEINFDASSIEVLLNVSQALLNITTMFKMQSITMLNVEASKEQKV